MHAPDVLVVIVIDRGAPEARAGLIEELGRAQDNGTAISHHAPGLAVERAWPAGEQPDAGGGIDWSRKHGGRNRTFAALRKSDPCPLGPQEGILRLWLGRVGDALRQDRREVRAIGCMGKAERADLLRDVERIAGRGDHWGCDVCRGFRLDGASCEQDAAGQKQAWDTKGPDA